MSAKTKHFSFLLSCFLWITCDTDRQDRNKLVDELNTYNQAKRAYKNLDFVESLALYHRALPNLERPFLDSAIYNIGYCQLQLDSNLEAMQSFLKSAELNYRKADAFFNIGLINYALFNDSLAIYFFYKTLEIDSTYKDAEVEIQNIKKGISDEYRDA